MNEDNKKSPHPLNCSTPACRCAGQAATRELYQSFL